ncbi:MAG: class I SAM-dependent methyltransferase [Bdellovibrionales bacterium]|nr:class I SAM-dependent methyltransferase [Bdellovibrionales bacterium]
MSHLGADRGAKILNVGCGDGVLDICLSRLSMHVTAVDRNPSVLAHAKSEDDTKTVNFVLSDLRKLNLPSGSFQSALFLECSGLVDKEQDLQLFRNIYEWLAPGGKFIVDCPLYDELSGSWSKVFPEGELTFHHTFDPETRMFRIEPSFKETTGQVFGLMDPIRDNLPGLSRYYYPKAEISSMLKSVGFSVKIAEPHYYGEKYFAILATK